MLFRSEELGITKANADELRKTSANPNLQRLLGQSDDITSHHKWQILATNISSFLRFSENGKSDSDSRLRCRIHASYVYKRYMDDFGVRIDEMKLQI